jgi:glycosyltransferase involved in cell wall biosynthesis
VSERSEHPRATVVVPVFNEEEMLEAFYARLAPVLDSAFDSWELVFVDDGSSDRSVPIMRALHDQDQRVQAVRLAKNVGSHIALAAGLDHANGDVVVILAADLQDPPEVIPEFVARWREGYEIVWGARESRDDPAGRALLARAFYAIIRRTALPDIPRTGTGSFCLLDQAVVQAVRSARERNRFTLGLVSWLGFAQTVVPYQRAGREAGASKWSLRARVKLAVDIFVSFSYLPIRAISYFGIVISAVSFTFALYVIIDWVVAGTTLRGWPSIMVAVLFLGGVQLVTLGIIGEYVWRIAEEARARPLYVVRELIGMNEAAFAAASGPTRS